MTDTDAPSGTGPPAGAETRTHGPRVDAGLLASAPAALVAGALLAFGGRHSALALLVAVAIVQAAFAITWVIGTGMPGRRGGFVLAALAAGASDVVVSVWPHGRLGALVAVLGLAVPVMFVHQLTRGAARSQVVSSLSAMSLLVIGVVALPALVQLRHEFAHDSSAGRVVEAVAAAAAVALVAGYLVDVVLPIPRFDVEVPRGALALLVSTGVGAAIGHLVLRDDREFAAGRALFVGGALGALAGLLAVVAAFVLHTTAAPRSQVGRTMRPVLAALLPLCLLAPAAFLLCLAIRA